MASLLAKVKRLIVRLFAATTVELPLSVMVEGQELVLLCQLELAEVRLTQLPSSCRSPGHLCTMPLSAQHGCALQTHFLGEIFHF